ncbi:lytic transglycosylase domain-containing protein [Luteibaculum oceani]|uniref:LysM peptidoglycan-binding domain-containing protein n=1 Tax=Luteibaculum oceani TaxID=1294296 RepID=A0A5C6VID9_9FLAO|nr:lytic transglycosylase domain-containing protein [Luteibaculum oceani]TXC85302.1 LysM peptidoglycan-binding domain-containing protein [Luteibaculum oceani]
MRILAVITFIAPIFACLIGSAQPIDKPDTIYNKHNLKSLPAIELARWDKMYMEMLSETEELSKDVHPLKIANTAGKEDSITAARLRSMSFKSPFSFPYNNKVQAFINMYLGRKKELTQRMLGLAEFYYPEIEAALDKYDLPLELKHLVAVESAFNPRAKSRAGAVGMWQFMYGTGKIYGLKVSSYTDDRMDPAKSTDAACRFLKDLYKMYGNWELALAAYNSGPGNVNKAIRYSGGHRNYWKIYNWLPRETRGYVPAFIAVNYIFEYYKELGIEPIAPEQIFSQAMDTIHINHPWNLNDVSDAIGVSKNELKLLNPCLKSDFIPYLDKPYVLNVPYRNAIKFAEQKSEIEEIQSAKRAMKEEKQEAQEKVLASNNVTGVHVVRKGETLSLISKLYGCSVADLKRFNGLVSSRIDIGQRLNVPTKNGRTTAQTSAPAKQSYDPSRYKYYTIQPGDTLWDIAQKNGRISYSELKKLNRSLDVRNLKPGQKIIIGVNSAKS